MAVCVVVTYIHLLNPPVLAWGEVRMNRFGVVIISLHRLFYRVFWRDRYILLKLTWSLGLIVCFIVFFWCFYHVSWRRHYMLLKLVWLLYLVVCFIVCFDMTIVFNCLFHRVLIMFDCVFRCDHVCFDVIIIFSCLFYRVFWRDHYI